MKILYTLKYKRYSDIKELHIVAPTPLKAIERAKPIIRKNEYGDKEILSVTKEMEIDGVA